MSNPDATLSIQTATTDATLLQEVVRLRTTGRSSVTGTNNRGTLLSFFDESNPTLTSAVGGIREAPSGNFAGALAFYTNTGGSPSSNVSQLTQRMLIDSAGRLLVGTSVSGFGQVAIGFNGALFNALELIDNNPTTGTGYLICRNSAGTEIGSIKRVGATNAIVFNTTSDERLKSNIVDANPVLEKLMSVRVRQYDWTEGDLHQDYGFIAQELEPVLSGIVTKGKTEEDMWQLDYSRITPCLVKAIQELNAKFEALTTRLEKAGL
jgi:hypothetical protein